ncbi:MAG: Rieske 2Fe-2S domain-containing protein [Bdellovibrionota bacterium]
MIERRLLQSNEVVGEKLVKVSIDGEPHVVFRDETGRAVALLDRCPHRGAPLSEGNCKAGLVQCPYHGWTVDGRGQVVDVPSEGNSQKADRKISVEAKALRESDGWIYVTETRASIETKLTPLEIADGEIRNEWYILALDREVSRLGVTARTVYDRDYEITRVGGKIRVARDGRPISHVLQDGCVWIWTGDESVKTEGPAWRFPESGNGEYGQYFMITDFDNEVTHLAQNFMDVPHTVFVHAGWFRRKTCLPVPITIDVGGGRVKVTYHQKNDAIGFWARILNPKNEPMIHTDEFIFPNLTRVDYRFGQSHFIINSQCTPVSRYKSRVFTWIAYRVGALTRPLSPFMRFYTRQVIEQDVDIMKIHGANLARFEKSRGPFAFTPKHGFHSTGADELHIAIDRIRELGIKNKPGIEKVEFTREREFWI